MAGTESPRSRLDARDDDFCTNEPERGEDSTSDPHEEDSDEDPEQAVEVHLEFTGNAREYFRLWIVNTCLTILTFGIYSAWAKVRKQRYLYSRLLLDGIPFEYHGRPGPILRGRLIGVSLIAAWYITAQVAPKYAPLLILLAVLVAPWILVKSFTFRAYSTSYRNIRFEFLGSMREALTVVYGWSLVLLVTWGFALPWFEQRIRKYMISNTWYGETCGEFSAEGGHFFRVYRNAGAIAALLALATSAMTVLASPIPRLGPALGLVMSYVSLVAVFAYRQARLQELCWRRTCFGGLFFRAALSYRKLLGLYATNCLAIVGSCGLAVPWAAIRTLRYRVEQTQVYLEGSFDQFRAATEPTSASGAEVLDALDLDLAI